MLPAFEGAGRASERARRSGFEDVNDTINLPYNQGAWDLRYFV
jgi:hypothetical protein